MSRGLFQRGPGDHASQTAIVSDYERFRPTRRNSAQRITHRLSRVQHDCWFFHGLAVRKRLKLPIFFSGKPNSILTREYVEQRLFMQDLGNRVRNHVCDHYRQHDLVVLRHFKNHEERCNRSSDDSGKRDSHPDQGVSSRREYLGREVMCSSSSYRSAQHGSNKERGREKAAGVSRREGDRRGQQLHGEKQDECPENNLSIQRIADRAVTDAENTRRQQRQRACENSSNNSDDINWSATWNVAKSSAKKCEKLCESRRCCSPYQTKQSKQQ